MANTKNLIRLQFSELNINDILKTVRCSENGRCFLSTFVETPINDCQQENVCMKLVICLFNIIFFLNLFFSLILR